jgi:hypothetical protein
MSEATDPSINAATPAPPAPVLGYHVPRSGKLVSVASCGDAAEGQMVASALSASGIPSAVVNEHTNALGGYAGRTWVEVHVGVEDRDRAVELVEQLRSGDAFEPEEEPSDGSAEFAEGAGGARIPLGVAGEFDTAREMYDAAAVLGSARVATYLPNLVPRKEGGPPRAFVVRVPLEELDRALEILEEAEEEDEEDRCRACGSWQVRQGGEGAVGAALRWLRGGKPHAARYNRECIKCGNRWWVG